MKKLVFALAVISSATASATAGAEASGGHEGIPLKEIGLQAVNLGILLVILFFATKESIKALFINRRKEFVEKSEKTKNALQMAELALSDVKAKLTTLEAGEKSSSEKAVHEANLMKANLIKESEAQALKLKEDSKMSLNVELDKARQEISEMILGGAVSATTRKISDKKTQVTKDSESEFLRQVGQVKA